MQRKKENVGEIKSLDELKAIIKDITDKYKQIVQISIRRVELIDKTRLDEQKQGIKIETIIKHLKDDINKLYSLKENYVNYLKKEELENEKKAENTLRRYLKDLILLQRKYFVFIDDEMSEFSGIMHDAVLVKKNLEILVGNNGELLQIANYLDESIKNHAVQKKDTAKLLLKTIESFISELSKLRLLNEKFFTLTTIDANVVRIYQGHMLHYQNEKIDHEQNLQRLANDFLIELKNERAIIEAIFEFDKMTETLEKIVQEINAQFPEVENHETMGIMQKLGKAGLGIAAALSLIVAINIATPNISAQTHNRGRGAYESQAGFSGTIDISMSESITGEIQHLKENPNYYKLKEMGLLEPGGIANCLVAIQNNYGVTDVQDAFRTLDELPNEISKYDDDSQAEAYYELALLFLDNVKQSFMPGTPVLENGAKITEPDKYLEHGFLLLPANWLSELYNSSTRGLATRTDHVSERIAGYAMFSIRKNQSYAKKFTDIIVARGMVKTLGQLARIYSSAGLNQEAYNALLTMREHKITTQQNYVWMVETAKKINDQLTYMTIINFINDFKPQDVEVKGFGNQVNEDAVKTEHAVLSFIYEVFKAPLLDKKGKWNPKPAPRNATLDNQSRNYASNLTYMARILNNENSANILMYALGKYWNDDVFVMEVLPTIGVNENSAQLFEIAIHDKRIIQNKPSFKQCVSDLWEYYNKRNMDDEKNELATFYKENK